MRHSETFTLRANPPMGGGVEKYILIKSGSSPL